MEKAALNILGVNDEIRTRYCKAKILFGRDRRDLSVLNKQFSLDNRDSIVFKVTPLGYKFGERITYKVEIVEVIPTQKNSMLLELIGKENTGIVEGSNSLASTD